MTDVIFGGPRVFRVVEPDDGVLEFTGLCGYLPDLIQEDT